MLLLCVHIIVAFLSSHSAPVSVCGCVIYHRCSGFVSPAHCVFVFTCSSYLMCEVKAAPRRGERLGCLSPSEGQIITHQ